MKRTKSFVSGLFALMMVALMLPFASASGTCNIDISTVDVSCEGGDIIYDNTQGDCRTTICQGSPNGYGDQLRVLTCEKPDEDGKVFYESYVQESWIDELVLNVGDVRVDPSESGFFRSENVGLLLILDHWYPQGLDVVMHTMGVGGFNPVSFDWSFGDGSTLEGISNDNTFHTFAEGGEYTYVVDAVDANGNTCHAEKTVTVQEE